MGEFSMADSDFQMVDVPLGNANGYEYLTNPASAIFKENTRLVSIIQPYQDQDERITIRSYC